MRNSFIKRIGPGNPELRYWVNWTKEHLYWGNTSELMSKYGTVLEKQDKVNTTAVIQSEQNERQDAKINQHHQTQLIIQQDMKIWGKGLIKAISRLSLGENVILTGTPSLF